MMNNQPRNNKFASYDNYYNQMVVASNGHHGISDNNLVQQKTVAQGNKNTPMSKKKKTLKKAQNYSVTGSFQANSGAMSAQMGVKQEYVQKALHDYQRVNQTLHKQIKPTTQIRAMKTQVGLDELIGNYNQKVAVKDMVMNKKSFAGTSHSYDNKKTQAVSNGGSHQSAQNVHENYTKMGNSTPAVDQMMYLAKSDAPSQANLNGGSRKLLVSSDSQRPLSQRRDTNQKIHLPELHSNKTSAMSNVTNKQQVQQKKPVKQMSVVQQMMAPSPGISKFLEKPSKVVMQAQRPSVQLGARQSLADRRRQEQAERPRAKKEVILSEQEIKTFGNRCPPGYKKIKLLGKGGIAVVWLCQRIGGDEFYAMKQFPKQQNKTDSSAQVELQMQKILRDNSTIEEQEDICMLRDSAEDKKDLWLIYELCPGKTMNEHLFDVRGEFYKGERIYMVHHSNFYHCLRNNMDLLKEFIYRVASGLSLLGRLSIVHADLKPDNILIDFDEQDQVINSLKIIDLGSSFLLNPQGHVLKQQSEFGSSTPEYLPPEIHSYLAKRFTQQTNIRVQDFNQCSYIFDVWSLGSILLEALSGFPLWLSLKARVVSLDGRNIMNYGLFGVAGRDNAKILNKQNQLFGSGFQNLLSTLRKGFAYTGTEWVHDRCFLSLFAAMLNCKPGQRISPEEILNHEFLAWEPEDHEEIENIQPQ